MAVPVKIFKTHLAVGKAISSFIGFADDHNLLCYIVEHLTAKRPLKLTWFRDKTLEISIDQNAIGGGSSYTPPASANGIALNSNGTASVVHVYAQAGVNTAVSGTDTVITAPEVYLRLDVDDYGTRTLSVVFYSSGVAPSPAENQKFIRLYTMASDLVTVSVDWRTAPQFTVFE